MITSVEIKNGSSHDPGHASKILGALVNRKLVLDIVYMCAKFNDSSFSRSRDIIGTRKI